MKALSIYIHIPFCVQKCRYCDFLSVPANDTTKAEYVEALIREIKREAKYYTQHEIITIFFGGGTPSILSGTQIKNILHSLRSNYHFSDEVEITIEMNPATADKEKMQQLIEAGVNRLSIGLQSANDSELKMLGRVHSYEDFLNTYKLARDCGFKNINVDLMSALPGQSFETYTDTLDKILDLGPEHISAYSLIVEENTYLFQNIASFPPLPDEDEDRLMYKTTKMKLHAAGYERYEISNYAKEGYECKHNTVYWRRGDYAGFGIGAASLVGNKRWNNVDSLTEYLKAEADVKIDIELLDTAEEMEEFMILGLRMMAGVSKEEFKKLYGKRIEEVYPEAIKKWAGYGYLLEDEKSLKLSEEGIDVSNQILADFMV